MGKGRIAALYGSFGIMDNCQGTQPQKVHLQQTQTLDLGHVELGDRQAVVGGKRHILGGRFPGNDNTSRMGGGVPGHAFHLQGSINQFVYLRVRLIQVLQIGRNFQRMLQGHFQLHGNELGYPVHILIRHAHHPAYIAHGGPGGHGAEGHDLGHMVTAILFVDVIDDLLPALVAEVYVKVGHGNTFRVEESFKDEVITNGVDVGDAHTVGCQTARAGTAPRSYRDATVLGIIDEIENDEVVVGIPHLGDNTDLVIQTVPQFLGDTAGIPALQPIPTKFFKVCLVFHAVRCLEIGQLGLSIMEVKAALFRNAVGVFAGFRDHGK